MDIIQIMISAAAFLIVWFVGANVLTIRFWLKLRKAEKKIFELRTKKTQYNV